ncbi:hypothetical protein GXW82_01565 [Streptacidiphilus sp. 4-A2]|nr:hypothetical protein [Streptacidiphilus sp. 4-A2]
MRYLRLRRAAGPALLVPISVLLSACGIPTTGVVQAGDPGTGITQPTIVVFFLKNSVPVPSDEPSTDRSRSRRPCRPRSRARMPSNCRRA